MKGDSSRGWFPIPTATLITATLASRAASRGVTLLIPSRITRPMIRKSIDLPWREVTWREAIDYAASEFKRIQEKHGRGAVGAITVLAMHQRGNVSRTETGPRRVRQ